MFEKVVSSGQLSGYKVGEMEISHLQFVDDKLIIGEKSMSNIWSIKAILQLFECISSLKVRFCKSQLYGVNVGDGWTQKATEFLNCKVGAFPFIYLGLHIGGVSCRKGMWQPVIDRFWQRLTSWNSSSLGGKIILLKSVLSVLPIY